MPSLGFASPLAPWPTYWGRADVCCAVTAKSSKISRRQIQVSDITPYEGRSRAIALVERLKNAGVTDRALDWGPRISTMLLAISGGITSVSPGLGLALILASCVAYAGADTLISARNSIKEDRKTKLQDKIKDLEAQLASKVKEQFLVHRTYIAQMNSDLASILATALRTAEQRANGKKDLSRPAYNEELKRLQQGLLTHCVRVLSDMSLADLPERALSANWTLRGEGDFIVVVYDREHLMRPAGRTHPINKSAPGASQAFLTGDISLVPNTESEETREFFTPGATYRAILSIPAINAKTGRVIGVVNVDSTTAETLSITDAQLILDAVYTIGLLELLKDVQA